MTQTSPPVPDGGPARPSSVPERVLVTGGSGFIGTNLVEHYLQAGAAVVNFDVRPPRHAGHRACWQAGDLLDAPGLGRVLDDFRPDLVLHMAARTDLSGRSRADYAANVEGVRNLVGALGRRPGVGRVLFGSSMLVCRLGHRPAHDLDYCPDTPYGESKVAGEQVVREGAPGPAWSIVRPTSIWGPWFSVPYRDFFDAVAAGRYVHPRGRPVHRSYGFVLNTVRQIAAIAAAPPQVAGGRTYYLADYEPLEVRAWADLISRAWGRGAVREVPLAWLRLAAALGDAARWLGMRPPLTRRRLRNLLTPAVYDLTATRALCPELPFGVERAVGLTVDWLRGQAGGPAAASGNPS